MLIDTHAHLNFNAYKKDSKEVLEGVLSFGMALIMPGSQFSTSRRAVDLAEEWDDPRVWAAVGLHPIHLEERTMDKNESVSSENFETHSEEFDKEKYLKLALSKKVVAIGEIGLDYWNRPRNKEKGLPYATKQKEVLIQQLNLALSIKKPVILHCRVAHKDLLNILREHSHTETFDVPGVIHSYTGSVKQLKKFLQMGYYIGINGLIFKLPMMREAVEAISLDRILLETDSPYLTPPQVKEERNSPINLKYIVEEIAKIKQVNSTEVEKQTSQNAKRVFGIDFS